VKIGYIGLGSMGGRLAARLLHSHDLYVYDRDPAAVAAQIERGAKACASAAELAAACDVVLLCLPTSDHVRTVLFGDGGLAAAARPGTLIVDQTSGDPVQTRQLAAELAELGIDMADAPVSGGPAGADAGTIAIMVGGSDERFAQLRPILEPISPNIFHAGPIGAGHVVKAANNMLSAVNRMVSLEALALVTKNGVDAHRALEIFLASSGRNFHLETFVAEILAGKLDSGFTLGLMHKDVKLACRLGVDSGTPLQLGDVVRNFYQMCVNEWGYDGEVNNAALLMDRLAASTVVPEPPAPGR